ncbi:MAG: YjgP/YjgQ family permease [Planctomycetes bacterium]|nr:YjgP/YjgQ family permease [Planctomycetota bacterium]
MIGALRFDLLDRYVARVFLGALAVVFTFFFGFFLVIDLFGNADDFVETARKLAIPARTMVGWVAGLYLYKAPSIFLQVAPFVTVIGGIVAVARLNRQNELIPVLMSGRSVFRMLRPLFVVAALLTALMLLVQEFVAPAAADHRLARASYLRDGRSSIVVHTSFADAQRRHWMRIELDPIRGALKRAEVRFVDGERSEIIDLKDAVYDSVRGGWTQPGGIVRWVDDHEVHSEQRIDLLESDLTPARIAAQEKEPFDLSFAELGALLRTTGDARFQVLLHFHITFPLANLLLLLLALPFVLRYDRQRVMQGFAIAFFLCLAYFGIDAALRTLGESKLHPILAAWFAPLFFGALGISLFDGVQT